MQDLLQTFERPLRLPTQTAEPNRVSTDGHAWSATSLARQPRKEPPSIGNAPRHLHGKASPRSPRSAPPICAPSWRRRPSTARRHRASPARSPPCAASFASVWSPTTPSTIPHTSCGPQRSAKPCQTCSTGPSSRVYWTHGEGTGMDAPARRQDRARPSPARPVRLRRAAPLRAVRAGLRRRGPRAAAVACAAWQDGKERVVPIHPGLVPLFIAYAAQRPETASQALFLGVHGRRLFPATLAARFAATSLRLA